MLCEIFYLQQNENLVSNHKIQVFYVVIVIFNELKYNVLRFWQVPTQN